MHGNRTPMSALYHFLFVPLMLGLVCTEDAPENLTRDAFSQL